MLDEDWHGFSFGVNIHYENIYIEIVPFILAIVIFSKHYRDNCVGFFLTMMTAMAFIPSNSALTISNVTYSYYIMSQIYMLMLMLLIGRLSVKIGHSSISAPIQRYLIEDKRLSGVFRFTMIFATSLVLIKVYMQNGLDFTNLFIGEMYDVRGANADFYSSHEGSFYAYLSIFADSAMFWFVPIFLFVSLIKKNVIDLSLTILALLAEFSASMMKATLFVLLIIVFVLVLTIIKKTTKASLYFLISLISLFVISYIEYISNGVSIVFETLIRRLFYMTQYMVQCHYDFFSCHNKFYFTHECFIVEKIMSALLGSAHSSGAIKLVSDYCFAGTIPAPNAGMFAEAYAQIGAMGAVAFPFIHYMILKQVYKYATWYGDSIALVLMVKFYLRLNSVYVLETGYFVALLFFIIVTKWLQKKSIASQTTT